jgi:hypothetical protein
MPQSEPSFVNQMQVYRPPCSRCGQPTTLARIEPAGDPGHDLRTFECTICTNADTVKTAYRDAAR